MKPGIGIWSGVVLLFCLWGCTSTGAISETVQEEKNSDQRLVDLGNGICQDTASGLMWLKKKGDVFNTWENATAYADQLEYGGYTDWRLPTKNELYSLQDIFFWKKNGGCLIDTAGSYWSGLTQKDAASGYWETYYLCSPEYKFVDTPGKGRVRAVRP